ncbi:hypothetical protein NDN08_004220 [Rhodosorus marinus]|uniref:Anaphase-promoting complex subunit 4 WD40 domain-containing protein n=1 Tax=Rhodosorus marinus TaxID=101924 RepID=A0AAV8UJ16_9RHOD|nr:hypothetical protein NDN08_004220 [Rhodosorus marinus]
MSIEGKQIFCGVPNTARGEASHVFADPTGETDRISYASGRSAVVVSCGDRENVKVFTDHTRNVTACRFAPKGLIASGDEGGTIRVWNPETMKQREELPVTGDVVRDVCFTSDMKFMAFATDARGVFAKVVKYPGCGSAGPVSGHTRRVTSIDIRNSPKTAVITGGDDMIVGFYSGPPIPLAAVPIQKKHHTNFVLDVRFSPDGSKYATSSSDRSVFIFDSESQEKLHSMTGHTASVTGVAWNKDGTKLVTSSSDKTIRVWDVASGSCLEVVSLGDKDVLDMQVGCTWVPKTNEIVAVSLRGDISVLVEGSSKPSKVIRGHANPIVSLTNLENKVYTVDSLGKCVFTDTNEPRTDAHFSGNGHKTTGKSIACNSKVVVSGETSGDVLLTLVDTLEFPSTPVSVKGGCADIACPGTGAEFAAVVINDFRLVQINYDGSILELLCFEKSETGISVSVTEDGKTVAVSVEVRGGAGKTSFYKNTNGKLEKFGDSIDGATAANRMIFTKDGSTLIIGEKSRHVKMFDVTKQVKVTGGGACHSARVDGLSLAPDGKRVASVGMDGTLAIWVLGSRSKPISAKAHRNGANGVGWVDGETLVTGGGDNSVRTWTLKE